MADYPFPVRPHDDRVAAEFISFIQNFRCGIAVDDVDSDDPLQGFRIVLEFPFGELLQAFFNS